MNLSETTNLLRRAADEELTSEEVQALESHLAAHPQDREFIAFERRLRGAVGRVMGDVSAPQDVRAAVQAQAAQPALRLAGTAASAPGALRAAPRRLLAPSGLAAGVVLLVGAAVVIGLSGRADWFDWFRAPQIDISSEDGSLGFPIDEHRRCESDATYAQKKFTLHSREQLRQHFADELHWNVSLPDLGAFGYEFAEAGNCSVGRGTVDSVHLRYTNGPSTLSVWIEQSMPSDLTHSAAIVEGHAYLVTPTNREAARDAKGAYYAWRDCDFVYRLVPASVDQAREMAVAIGMPDVPAEEIH